MGSVVISLDGELGWGRHLNVPSGEYVADARSCWYRLLERFDEFDVPATWAIVGHLFHSKCDERHEEHPAGERCCTRAVDDTPAEQIWFGSELVDAVRSADVDHEIASHGYTHWRFDHEGMTEAIAERELRRSIDAAGEVELSSFVFPVNRMKYRRLLAEYGFDCYRGPNPRHATESTFRRRATKIGDAFVRATPPPIVTPTVDEYGLVNVPASLYLSGFEGPLRSVAAAVGRDPIVAKAKRGIDAAVGSDGVFHMWLHPHDLVAEHGTERMEPILEYLRDRVDATDLRIETMNDVADRVNAGAGSEPNQRVVTGGGP